MREESFQILRHRPGGAVAVLRSLLTAVSTMVSRSVGIVLSRGRSGLGSTLAIWLKISCRWVPSTSGKRVSSS